MPDLRTGVFEVCLFRLTNDQPQYLLLKRSDADPLYPGIWQVVTGTLQEGESAADGALREVREETGLEPTRFWSVPLVNSFYVPREDAIVFSPFFAGEIARSSEPRLSEEHLLYKWASLSKARTLIPWPGQRRGIELVHEYIAGKKDTAPLVELTDIIHRKVRTA